MKKWKLTHRITANALFYSQNCYYELAIILFFQYIIAKAHANRKAYNTNGKPYNRKGIRYNANGKSYNVIGNIKKY